MNIAFFGTPTLSQIILEGLIKTEFKPTLVITAPDTKFGRGQKIKITPVGQTAQNANIKVLKPQNLNNKNFIEEFKKSNINLVILEAYGKIIPQSILQIPKFGFINPHPSLLPKFRGPSPIQSAILSGEKNTGVTIILLDQDIDHGPVLAQKSIPINQQDTHVTLSEKLAKLALELLLEILPEYIGGKLTPKTQNHSQATLTDKITKQDGEIDINRPPTNLLNMINAYYPWPTVWTKTQIQKKEMIIKFLPNRTVQPEGKKPMSVSDFKNGYRINEDLEKFLKVL